MTFRVRGVAEEIAILRSLCERGWTLETLPPLEVGAEARVVARRRTMGGRIIVSPCTDGTRVVKGNGYGSRVLSNIGVK
jgi:hypothetical protein